MSMISISYGGLGNEKLDDGWKNLTLREKIGQTVIMTGSSLVKSNTTDAELAAYLEKYPVGGVFDGGTVIGESGPTSLELKNRIARLSKASRIPLIICGDMEAGAGCNMADFTSMTSLAGVGATRSKALAYDFGRATAIEARSIGFNWLFTPVSDLSQNPFNYIVADRCMSDNPQIAIPLLISTMRGYQESRIAATAKHFPGDGVDYRNQHLTTSCNYLTRKAWEKNHGANFKALIDKGVMAIMTGHISLPCYQSDSEIVDGRYLPATLSHDLTTKLLKQKMGFKGVVVTDALMMGGFIKYFGEDAYVRSIAAGSDMLLWPPERYFDDMEKAVQSGRIPMSRLDDAVQRVWRMKQVLGVLNTNYSQLHALTTTDREFVKKTAQEIAEKSITLVRDRHRLLPLNPSAIHHVVIVPITSGKINQITAAAEQLQTILAGRGMSVSIRQGLWVDAMPKVAAENDLIIYLVGRIGFQSWYSTRGASDTWTYCMAGCEKTIVISLENPFHNDEFQDANTYINAYYWSNVVLQALTRGLFGEITFTGKSPVDLNMFRNFELDRWALRPLK